MKNVVLKNQIYEVKIEDISSDGNGICKVNQGFVIFVPNSVEGDILEIKILKVLKNYGYAKIQKIISPSKYRINPDCEVFNRCGGCSFRHIDYSYECIIKKRFVDNVFKKISDQCISSENVVENKNVDNYRNKVQLPLGLNNKNEVVTGFFSKKSHNIVQFYDCKLQVNIFNKLIRDIKDIIKKHNISVYDEITDRGLLRHIYIRYASATNQIMVCLVSKSNNVKNIDLIVDIIKKKYKNIKGILLNINDKKGNVILGNKNVVLYGNDYIYDVICGIKIKISVNSFYQINKPQAENIYNKAIEIAKLKKTDILLDLYCGTGVIGLIASKFVNKVIGIEIVPEAIKDAKFNAISNNISNIEFICSDAKNFYENILKENIDVIILDPPRKGCDKIVIESILKIKPKKIVMISCNPSTAARDCKYLIEDGYFIERIIPFDMFSRTNHVETVVLMSRVEK